MRRCLAAFVLVLAVGALAACGGGDGGGGGGGSRTAGRVVPGAPVLEVTADNLSFSPDELTVPAGDFTVALTSVDQFHDFVIEDVDGVVEASSGDTKKAGFKITKPGDYTFYCSVPGHRQGGMEGTLTVE